MIEEHAYGRILCLSADGAVQWSYVNRAGCTGWYGTAGWTRSTARRWYGRLRLARVPVRK